MNTTTRPTTGNTTYHRDGTITVWDCIQQQWVRGDNPSDDLLATMPRYERSAAIAHLNPVELADGETGHRGHAIYRTGTTTDNGRGGVVYCYAVHGPVCNFGASKRITSIAAAKEVINDWMS